MRFFLRGGIVVRSTRDFLGRQIPLRSFAGAKAVRVVHASFQQIVEHRHDWVSLTLPVIGSYTEMLEHGSVDIAGPSAILHPPGEVHANRIHEQFETVSVQFDAKWLSRVGYTWNVDRSKIWQGGRVALMARQLARVWTRGTTSEAVLAEETAKFVRTALDDTQVSRPKWLDHVLEAIDGPEAPDTNRLARDLDLHPAWLARAYRHVTGEGLAETRCRKRVERAARLLRCSDEPLAEIAVAAGFCDQSHMSRNFVELIGRTPLQVRMEREVMAQGSPTTARMPHF